VVVGAGLAEQGHQSRLPRLWHVWRCYACRWGLGRWPVCTLWGAARRTRMQVRSL